MQPAMRRASASRAAIAVRVHLPPRQALPYTFAAPAKQGRGFDSPKQRRNSRAGSSDSGFLLRSAFRFYGGTCGEGRKSLPVPLPGLSTPHVLPPSFDSVGCRFVDLLQRSHHG